MPNTESSAESIAQALRSALSFFESCGILLSPEQRTELEGALVVS
ncbi:hypothetical protein PSQ39_06430 [Curvibacter sp. HBC28]|uniref:Uncharacterized protein n=1 Tax=Curvibacter microcysteis TaxID=3026419 RepID=A0ABT5MEE2_9BURK|nr:hypothetical protein [Curvibacter sp. HBC28]MDD0814262.1 hypothetical protein [Curvibacter sp. HBC28]